MKIRKPRGMSTRSIFFATALGLGITYYTWYPAIEAYNQANREKKQLEAKLAKEFQEKDKAAAQASTGAAGKN